MADQGATTGTGTRWQETRPYKALIAVVGAFVLAISAVISDGIQPPEWAQVLIAASTALTVWLAANLPAWPYVKGMVAFIGGVTALGVSYITGDEVTAAEWWNLGVIALTAVGVIAIPNPVSKVGPVTGTGSEPAL